MSIEGVRNSNAACYQETVSRTAVGQDREAWILLL